jgi:hypothetical protein
MIRSHLTSLPLRAAEVTSATKKFIALPSAIRQRNVSTGVLTLLFTRAGRQLLAASALTALFLAAPNSASGQTLDDFKNAAGKRGVESIPFSSLRDAAEDANDEVQLLKDTVNKVPEAALLARQKDNILAVIRKLKEELAKEIAATNEILKDDDATAKMLAKEIEECQKDCQRIIDNAIARQNERMQLAADACGKFADARGKVREKFDEAKKLLDEAKSNPEKYLGSGASDEDKKKLGEYADSIKSGIASQEAEHLTQEIGNRRKSEELKAAIAKSS